MKLSLKKAIQKFDKFGMLQLILHFPAQIKEAIEIGEQIELDQPEQKISHVVVAGMGGSAIGGNILQKLFYASGILPCTVIRDYRLPAWVNRNTLVILSSYSGNTEETLSAYEYAISQGCACIACTSGGKLREMAANAGHPVIIIPGGRPPRTALGYLVFPLLVKFKEWGWIKSSLIDYDELITTLNKIKQENHPDVEDNLYAFDLAESCENRIPILYSSAEMETVAMRWKGQICENSKLLATFNAFPEMNHNEIIGWQRVAAMNLNQQLTVFFLRDQDDHPRIQKRMEIVRELIMQSRTPIIQVFSQGKVLLTRIFSLIYLADFVSFYLALLNREDPTPIKNIDYLKSSLANSK